MLNKLVSVIVPVYNVEKYIEKCILSICSQTYCCLEIIVVDDGSTDNSGILCDELARKDKRIKVIHKLNGGLSDARNAGLAIATGAYIAFVDSDDFVEPDFIELLAGNLEAYNADISCCRYNKVWENDKKEEVGGDHSLYVWKAADGLKEYLYGKRLDPFVCNKLFTADIIGTTRFIKGIVGEDNPFCIEILKRAETVVQAGESKYNYLQKRAGAITNSAVSQKSIDSCYRWDAVRRDCRDNYPSLEKYALRRQVLFYFGLYNKICSDSEYESTAQNTRMFIKEHLKDIVQSDICEATVKIASITLAKLPFIYNTAMRLYKKTVGEAKL